MRVERGHSKTKDNDIEISRDLYEVACKRTRDLDIYPAQTIQELLSSAYLLGVIDMANSLILNPSQSE